MGATKKLLEDLHYSKQTNRHNLGDAHWDAVIKMAEELSLYETVIKPPEFSYKEN